tara:strand:+ start:8412 stop:9014 length:603 start_codon:yes stop_codon:yes gene_type:complete
MKIIGVSQRLEISTHGELRLQIDIRLLNFILKCGYIPIPIPYYNLPNKKSLKKLTIWLNSVRLSGIVLSGGSNIGEYKLRDCSERLFIKYSLRKKIPIFGICRGMQIIGSYFNVRLKPVKKHINITHTIYSNKEKLKVNSFHKYSLKNCPKNFSVEFRSLDGNIESIKSNDKKIYACMWHPERYKRFKKTDIINFKKLFR